MLELAKLPLTIEQTRCVIEGHKWMERPPVVMPLRAGDARHFRCRRCGNVRTTVHPDSIQPSDDQ